MSRNGKATRHKRCSDDDERCLEPVKGVEKPWGSEEWLAVTDKYVLKFLRRRGTRSASSTMRRRRRVQYKGKLTLGRKEHPATLERAEFLPGECLHLMPGMIHQVEALEESMIIEASTTELLDVVRLKDEYGRKGTNKP